LFLPSTPVTFHANNVTPARQIPDDGVILRTQPIKPLRSCGLICVKRTGQLSNFDGFVGVDHRKREAVSSGHRSWVNGRGGP